MNDKHLAARIRAARRAKALTQRQLAERLGCGTRTIQGWEAGAGPPARGLLAALSVELDIPVIDLLG